MQQRDTKRLIQSLYQTSKTRLILAQNRNYEKSLSARKKIKTV